MKLLLPLLLCLLFTSCYEESSHYTLNPDGSGKVDYFGRFTPINFFEMDPDSEDYLHGAIANSLKQSKGIEAWTNLSFSKVGKEEVEFRVTAYFPNYELMEISRDGGKDGKKITITQLGDGEFQLSRNRRDNEKEEIGEDAFGFIIEEQESKSDSEILALHGKYAESLPNMMPFAEGLLKGSRLEETFTFSGQIKSVSGFSSNPKTTSVSYTYSGSEALKNLERSRKDPQLFLEAVRASDGNPLRGLSTQFIDSPITQGDPIAIFSSVTSPAFDYEAEVEAAKESYPEMLRNLGLPVPPKQVKGDLDFDSLEVSGISFNHATAHTPERERYRFFFDSDPGFTVRFRGTLPATVLSFEGGRLSKANPNKNEDLLKNVPNRARTIKGIKLLKDQDKPTITFDAHCDIPALPMTGFSEISGSLDYLLGDDTRVVELNLPKIEAGASDEKEGASIVQIKEADYRDDGSKSIRLSFNMGRDFIKEVLLYDASGIIIETRQTRSGGSDDKATITLTTEDEDIPKNAVITLEHYTDLRRASLNFSVTDIPLNPFSE